MSRDLRLFMKQLMRNPSEVVALAPSSTELANAMAAFLPAGYYRVVELGAGTGKITRALMKKGVMPDDITLVETSPEFCDHLRETFPYATVHQSRAQDLGSLDLAGTTAVVSGLPLLSMSVATQRAIVKAAFETMAPDGRFIQFTYGPVPPIHGTIIRELGLTYETSSRIWGNLPPAVVYCFRRLAQ